MEKIPLHILLKKGLGRFLVIIFLLLSLVPMTVVSLFSYRSSIHTLRQQTNDKLNAVSSQEVKKIKSYFRNLTVNLNLLAELRQNTLFLEKLISRKWESGLAAAEFVHSPEWAVIAEEMGPDLALYRRTYGYHDIFLIDNKGNILFSVAREENLGTNVWLAEGADFPFSLACRRSIDSGEISFSDFQRYKLFDDTEVFGFLAAPVINEREERIGIMVLQFAIDSVDEMVSSAAGLGNRAEMYLVGEDLRLRSHLKLDPDRPLLDKPVETEQTLLWQQHIRAEMEPPPKIHKAFLYTGPHGKQVLGLHDCIEIGGRDLGIIVEIEADEAFAPARRLGRLVIVFFMVTALVVLVLALLLARRMLRPVLLLTDGVRLAAEGDLDHGVEIRKSHELGVLADGFNTMLVNLRETMAVNARQNRLKTGQAHLADLLLSTRGIEKFTTEALRYIAGFVDARVGLFYVAEEDGSLWVAGSYACAPPENEAGVCRPGEGLVGQAALDKKYIALDHCSTGSLRVESGLFSSQPDTVLVYPLLFGDRVMGVLELGLLHECSARDFEFLEAIAEQTAMAIDRIQAIKRTRKLLRQTQEQAEELQARKEELKASNEELEQSNTELEKNAVELKGQTAQLEKQQTEIEQKASDLELASRYKSQFLANMSHELRTPLNAILLLSRLMADNKDNTLSADDVQSLETIHSSGSDLLELINDVLDIAKVESGRMMLSLEYVELARVTENMQRIFQSIADMKGLDLSFSVAPGLPKMIRTDRQRLEQILKNFLSNGCKFTKQGGVMVQFCRPADLGGNAAALLPSELYPEKSIAMAVTDTGIGIAEEKQQLIFEPFRQADGSTSRQYGGTGLGLSISRELAHMLGGEIAMTSESGRGSTFILFLPEQSGPGDPLARLDSREEPTEDVSLAAGSSGPSDVDTKDDGVEGDYKALRPEDKSFPVINDGQDAGADRQPKIMKHLHDQDEMLAGRKILLVDDDMRNVFALKKLLNDESMQVVVGKDGLEALKRIEEHADIDLILMDIMMPKMDGYEAMAEIRKRQHFNELPIIALTAKAMKGDRTKCIKAGASDYLAKPVDSERLLSMLRVWLCKHDED
ncbi:MAG: response regulator [Thermodesulfobacteriota bacterium]|nr:response regulator [Thermodesulfobacteriota bacterium]